MKNIPTKITIFVLLLLFAFSRWYIYSNPPKYYSDVTADYERYANMWRYGLTPYREHLYEYPPATIPLLSLPLTLDQAGIGKYYSNYRTQILLIDTLFFIYLLWIIRKIPWLKNYWGESLLFYIILSTFAKEFLYEGIDLAFTAAATVAFSLVLFTKKRNFIIEVVIWMFFWLSAALKFLTIPLAAPLFLLLHRGKILQQLTACILGFIIVWGVPLALYRSSLQVSFVHNNNRPLKYASFPTHIIRWIDAFSDTEEQRMVAPDFEYQGPVSTEVTKITKVVFPLAVLLLIAFTMLTFVTKTVGKLPLQFSELKKYLLTPPSVEAEKRVGFAIWFYMLYIFTLFITAKIFSQPFHIWYLPVLALLPFRNKKKWYGTIFLALLMILLDMTTFLHIKTNFRVGGVVEIAIVRDLFRFIPMFIIFYWGIQELEQNPLFSKQKSFLQSLWAKLRGH